MSSGHRIKRLRDMLDQLEQLPATAERDRMLREVRARVVDVDTGELPRAMLPVNADATLATLPTPTRRASRVVAPALELAPRVVDARPRETETVPDRNELPLATGVLLCLDDPPESAPEPAGSPAPWARGLRG